MTLRMNSFLGFTAFFVGIAGCAPSGPSPAVTQRLEVSQKFTTQIEDLTLCLASMTDVDSVLEQKPRVVELIDAVEVLIDELPGLPAFEDGERERYRQDLDDQWTKIEAAMQELQDTGKESMASLTSVPLDQQMKIMPMVMELLPRLQEIGNSMNEAGKFLE